MCDLGISVRIFNPLVTNVKFRLIRIVGVVTFVLKMSRLALILFPCVIMLRYFAEHLLFVVIGHVFL